MARPERAVQTRCMSGLIESPRSHYRRAAGARRDCIERRRRVEAGNATNPSPHVLSVTLRDEAGHEWRALGGGATVAEALAFAVESAPSQRRWTPVAWQDLYGG
jgi:hypothetical protein